jgi:uncharacterized radical SAM superfamily Fe-S cluster-containing enzyme
MSAEEVGTPLGQERLEACVFRLPIEGRMVPMCEVNAAGYRAAVHGGVADRCEEVTVGAARAAHGGSL